jgi:hypothetical protein
MDKRFIIRQVFLGISVFIMSTITWSVKSSKNILIDGENTEELSKLFTLGNVVCFISALSVIGIAALVIINWLPVVRSVFDKK